MQRGSLRHGGRGQGRGGAEGRIQVSQKFIITIIIIIIVTIIIIIIIYIALARVPSSGRADINQTLGDLMDWCGFDPLKWQPGELGSLVCMPKYHNAPWTILKEDLTCQLYAVPRLSCPLDRKVTVYNVKKTDQKVDGAWCLSWCEHSEIFVMCNDLDSPNRIVDVAAGLGGFTIGTSFLGMQTVVANDINEVMTKAYEEVNGGPIVRGDIGKIETVMEMHKFQGQFSSIFCLGFPCQPLSKQGDRLGSKDIRSAVLPAALSAAHFLQARMLVLENVPEAARDRDVQGLLYQFASKHGMIVYQRELHLHNVWPCRRSRWFAVLFPAKFGEIRD